MYNGKDKHSTYGRIIKLVEVLKSRFSLGNRREMHPFAL